MESINVCVKQTISSALTKFPLSIHDTYQDDISNNNNKKVGTKSISL